MTPAKATSPQLFTPFRLRGATFRNRIVIAPMQIYMADSQGLANDWHLQHLGKFAVGGAGLVFTEGLIVDPIGRSSYSDCGIWSDDQIPPLRRLTEFIRAQGALSAAQLHHAGAKAARRRGWDGFSPLDESDGAAGEPPWQPVGATTGRTVEKYHTPRALTEAEAAGIPAIFAAAAIRAEAAGFDVVEIHAAHGYLIHSFLSPISNSREDGYGGDLAGRMRLACEVAEQVRSVWPAQKPLFFRLSCVDGMVDGWSIEDSVKLAGLLGERGVDAIDCSSGGIRSMSSLAASATPEPGYQVAYADRIRRSAGIPTIAVGRILDPHQAEAILEAGQADLIAIGRSALDNPNWALHAARKLGAAPTPALWPKPYGWALKSFE